MKILAIIPARSGSKGIKNKNIRNLHGKPLMAYTIEAAIKSGVFDKVHLSTDSEEYASIGRKYGADIPFLREESISGDSSSTWETAEYVLRRYESLGQEYDVFAVLQPTSPFRNEKHIREAWQLYNTKNAKAVVGLCPVEPSPLKCDTILPSGSMKGFVDKKYRVSTRQSMDAYYRVNGAIYFLQKTCLDNIINYYDDDCYGYVMDSRTSLDIDEELDFVIAEAIFDYVHS